MGIYMKLSEANSKLCFRPHAHDCIRDLYHTGGSKAFQWGHAF